MIVADRRRNAAEPHARIRGKPAETITAYIVQVSLGDLPHGSIGYQSIFAAGLTLFLDDAGVQHSRALPAQAIPPGLLTVADSMIGLHRLAQLSSLDRKRAGSACFNVVGIVLHVGADSLTLVVLLAGDLAHRRC